MNIRVRTMLTDGRGEGIMGIGLLCLLETIDEAHSIAEAAREMGLSYVKALRILERLERHLGRQVVRRHKGGDTRGGAELTPAGRRLATDFRRLCDRVDRDAQRAFRGFASRHAKNTTRTRRTG